MLGKLLKYEFKATARMFLLMYAALLVVAGINALVLPFNDLTTNFAKSFPTLYSIISSLSAITFSLVITAVIVLTLVIIVVRFYRMLGDQGYLWFTLPVTSAQHIWSKLICAFVWSFASMIVVAISLGLMLLPLDWIRELWRIPDLWNYLVLQGFSPGLWLGCGVIFLITSWFSGIFSFYTSMAIGPNFTKSRLGGSVLAYILVYIATQILGAIQLMIISIPVSNMFDSLSPSSIDTLVLTFTVVFCIGFIALTITCYFITRHFLTKKLNLA